MKKNHSHASWICLSQPMTFMPLRRTKNSTFANISECQIWIEDCLQSGCPKKRPFIVSRYFKSLSLLHREKIQRCKPCDRGCHRTRTIQWTISSQSRIGAHKWAEAPS
ncbi:hypothetical protein TNCV_1051271 [Trichonephila clavipes]|nr:hypothetical protein TNCV_1051271 [Trichonephila clavipes]